MSTTVSVTSPSFLTEFIERENLNVGVIVPGSTRHRTSAHPSGTPSHFTGYQQRSAETWVRAFEGDPLIDYLHRRGVGRFEPCDQVNRGPLTIQQNRERTDKEKKAEALTIYFTIRVYELSKIVLTLGGGTSIIVA